MDFFDLIETLRFSVEGIIHIPEDFVGKHPLYIDFAVFLVDFEHPKVKNAGILKDFGHNVIQFALEEQSLHHPAHHLGLGPQ